MLAVMDLKVFCHLSPPLDEKKPFIGSLNLKYQKINILSIKLEDCEIYFLLISIRSAA